MKIAVHYNEYGEILGHESYPDTAVHGIAPVPGASHILFVSGDVEIDGMFVRDGELVALPRPRPSLHHEWRGEEGGWVDTRSLGAALEDSLKQVDHLAEQARSSLLGVSPGQGAVYEAKYKEAVRYIKHGPDEFMRWLPAEAEVRGTSVEDVAYEILRAHDAWESTAIQIECLRLEGKKRVRAARSGEEMHEVLRSLKFPPSL